MLIFSSLTFLHRKINDVKNEKPSFFYDFLRFFMFFYETWIKTRLQLTAIQCVV